MRRRCRSPQPCPAVTRRHGVLAPAALAQGLARDPVRAPRPGPSPAATLGDGAAVEVVSTQGSLLGTVVAPRSMQRALYQEWVVWMGIGSVGRPPPAPAAPLARVPHLLGGRVGTESAAWCPHQPPPPAPVMVPRHTPPPCPLRLLTKWRRLGGAGTLDWRRCLSSKPQTARTTDSWM